MNDIKHDIKKRHKNLSEFRYIAVGFFLTILSGAIMLSLPFSSRDGQWTNFLDSLFTAECIIVSLQKLFVYIPLADTSVLCHELHGFLPVDAL